MKFLEHVRCFKKISPNMIGLEDHEAHFVAKSIMFFKGPVVRASIGGATIVENTMPEKKIKFPFLFIGNPSILLTWVNYLKENDYFEEE